MKHPSGRGLSHPGGLNINVNRIPVAAELPETLPACQDPSGVDGMNWLSGETPAIPGVAITSLLGKGGMGAVYQAVQMSLDRDVAVKLLPLAMAASADLAARFEREARSLARLNHPNIVQIHDFGRAANGQPYFIMELVDGCDLRELAAHGTLGQEDVLNAMLQICSALSYAHGLGIVHRDIKPANILINSQGVLKVSDFGLAKLVSGVGTGPSGDPSLTLEGMAMGTPHYAAPEQLSAAQDVDLRADIYSLGVMFYELLTRELPRGASPAPSSRVLGIDGRLDAIVFKAMAPDPGSRYQSAAEFAQELEIVRWGEAPPAVATEPAAAGVVEIHAVARHREAIRIDHATRSLSTALTILGVVALAVIGGLALFLAQRKTGDTYNSEQTFHNRAVNNSHFTQLIASGSISPDDLAAITDVRQRKESLVAVTREPLDWSGAVNLARRLGASVMPLNSETEEKEMLEWLAGDPLATPASTWIRRRGAAAVLDGTSIRPPAEPGETHRALMLWDPTETRAAPSSPHEPTPR